MQEERTSRFGEGLSLALKILGAVALASSALASVFFVRGTSLPSAISEFTFTAGFMAAMVAFAIAVLGGQNSPWPRWPGYPPDRALHRDLLVAACLLSIIGNAMFWVARPEHAALDSVLSTTVAPIGGGYALGWLIGFLLNFWSA